MLEAGPSADPVAALDTLLRRYNSVAAARRRMRATTVTSAYGPLDEVFRDLESIKAMSDAWLDTCRPRVSIVIPAYNEEVEVIPTVLSFLWAVRSSGIPAEIVAVDNMSTDRTRDILVRSGVRVVECTTAGLRFSRAAGVAAVHPDCKYVWLVDADSRALAPIRGEGDMEGVRNPLLVSYSYMQEHPDCAATSTGIVYEYQVPLRRMIRRARIALRGGLAYSCWTGPNQFVRKECLMAIGGIDLAVDGGEDHHRIFQLARYARDSGMYVRGADREFSLLCPVHTSDRRNATLSGILRNLSQQLRKPPLALDSYGLPLHPKGVRYKDLFRRERGAARQKR